MRLTLILAGSLLLWGCSEPEPVRLTGGTMGTSWSLSLTEIGDRDSLDLHQQIMAVLAEVNAAMSTWDPESEISRFNRMQTGCMEISPAFAEVTAAALQIAAATEGAYDISLGPLIDLWGFGAAEGVSRPAAEQIDQTRAQVGYRNLHLEGQRLCKDADGIQINLSSIAKGYGVDVVARHLAEQGLENFLVEIGGELLAEGDKFGDSWRIGIENPTSGSEQSATLTLALQDAAVATSGDYRNYFLLDGQRYSHIIDARTGWPVLNSIASVTVVADSAMQADGWATALMAVGPERALQLADQQGLAILLILREAESFRLQANSFWSERFGALEPGR